MPPLTAGDALTTWQFAPPVSAALTLAAAAYLAAARLAGRPRRPGRPVPGARSPAARGRRRARRWPAGRSAAFLGGLAAIAVATQGSPGVYDDVLFSAHMAQHLLLIMVAPPLLIAGRPVTLALRTARGRPRRLLRRAVRSRPLALLTWPPVSVTLYAAVVASTHLTPLMNLVLANAAVHDGEHLAYLAAGYLYFLPVIGAEPARWRMPVFGRYLLLLATMLVDTVTGAILMLEPRVPWPGYAHSGRAWGPSPLADLHAGGIVMVGGSALVMTALAAILAVALVQAGDRVRAAGPGGLGAYNAYLGRLDAAARASGRAGRAGPRSPAGPRAGKVSRGGRISPGRGRRPAGRPR
ncbi:MAG TPA: cytochrome c oxidase assembly protein [Streptosporangiaceae bacterium]|nr:cytochrome c oxidase assembly protein [Streptosporangiaceae bacterium]